MVKALLNSINIVNSVNNIPNIKARLMSGAAEGAPKTDFEKLFDKQHSLTSNDKPQENKTETDEKKPSKKSSNNTFSGSVAYDLRQLLALIKSPDEDTTSDTEETDVQDIESAETQGAEDIADKLLSVEDEDAAKGKVEVKPELKPDVEVEIELKDLTERSAESFLEDYDSATEEVQTNAETQTTSKEVSKDVEPSLEDIIDEEQLKELKIESIEAKTSDSTEEEDIMQNQTPEEHGVKAMLQPDADFAEIKVEAKPNVSVQNTAKPASSGEVTPSKIIEQITKQMEGMYNASKVNIVLNPESLGKVSIQLVNTNEGLSAQFTVASQEVRDLIMKGLDGLKDTLLSHGVSVDNVSVKINDTQESEYNADWTEQEGSRGGNKEQGSHKERKEKDQFEQMMSFIEDENGKV